MSERETLRVALDTVNDHLRFGVITEDHAREFMSRIGVQGAQLVLELIPGSELAEVAIRFINDLRRHYEDRR